MAGIAVGVIALGLGVAVIWVKVGSQRVRKQAHEAGHHDTEEIPDH
jgi:hypothetical protein